MSTHSDSEALSTPIAILIGSVIIGGSIIFASSRAASVAVRQPAPVAQAPAAAAQPVQRAADVAQVKASGAQIVGSRTAPIVVAYWYDYQCPFCKRAEAEVMSQVMKEYVSTGKIRVVFKDLQFLGADSTSLGMAARAVGEVAPGKFYDWHKAIFENQGRENSGWATTARIRELTSQVLSAAETDRVMSLMVSKADEYRKSLDADKAEGSNFGVRSTPSFIVGKQLMVGLSSYTNIKSAIDAAIKR